MGEGSWIGLDVHARSVVAAVVDEVTGEVVVARAPVGVDELVAWVGSQRGPVRVAYEAGPTGFGLSRALDRLLVEAAWHHRKPHRTSLELERRRDGQRPEVRARAEQAGRRLHQRWRHLEQHRGIRSTVVAVAVARELAGFCWSLAVMDD